MQSEKLAGLQQVLLLLYTDRKALESYSKDPDKFLKAHDLSDQERTAIRGIPHHALLDFQRQLNAKRMSIAKKFLKKPNILIVLPFHYSGSPVIMWGLGPYVLNISMGMFLLMDSIGSKRLSFTINTLCAAYGELTNERRVHLIDLFRLAKLMYKHHLQKMTVVTI